MIKLYVTVCFLISNVCYLHSQGLINCGAALSIFPGSAITISGSDANFTNHISSTTQISGELYLQGNFTNNATINSIVGTVIFNGTHLQTIGGANITGFSKLIINNTGAVNGIDNVVLLKLPVSPSCEMSFIEGIMKTDSINILSIGNGVICNEGNSLSFADGPVEKIGVSGFTFPTGDISGNDCIWAPIGMEGLCAFSEITAEYIFNNFGFNLGAANMCEPSLLDHVSGIEYWRVSSTNAFPQVTLYWKDNVRSQITKPDELVVSYWYDCSGFKWVNMGGIVSDNSGSGSVTSTLPFISFGAITFGTKNNSNPLPIELLKFEASCENDIVTISWSTASETNNSYFSLEKSVNLYDWINIATIKGAGNSNQIINYSYFDENDNGLIVYYRLSQTDYDGSRDTFPSIQVSCKDFGEQVKIEEYPNPFKKEITISIINCPDNSGTITLFDVIGNKILEIPFAEKVNQEINTIVELRTLSNGIYFVELKSLHFKRNIKIIKN